MEPPHRVELWSKHYKCLVLAFVLWRHMEARVDHDSTPVDYGTTILPTYTISPNGADDRTWTCTLLNEVNGLAIRGSTIMLTSAYGAGGRTWTRIDLSTYSWFSGPGCFHYSTPAYSKVRARWCSALTVYCHFKAYVSRFSLTFYIYYNLIFKKNQISLI